MLTQMFVMPLEMSKKNSIADTISTQVMELANFSTMEDVRGTKIISEAWKAVKVDAPLISLFPLKKNSSLNSASLPKTKDQSKLEKVYTVSSLSLIFLKFQASAQ